MDRPSYREFKAHDKNLNGRLIKAGDGRVYIEMTPYRYKYVQTVLFIIFTAAAIIVSNIIANNYIISGEPYGYRRHFEVSPYYCSIIYLVLLSENYFKYLFAGFRQAPENYSENQGKAVKRTKPSFMDIFADAIKLDPIERKKIRKNFIFCADGSIFGEKNFNVYYKAWDIILHLSLIISFLIIFMVDFLPINMYIDFYRMIGLSFVFLCVFLVFPAIRWRFNKFEEIDIDEVLNTVEEKQ